jgi:two-component system heavy metal sensor histidine kinase CusS
MRWPQFDRIPWATLRVRLTLWNSAVVLSMTAAALLAVRFGARAALFRETDAVLRGEVTEVAMALGEQHPDMSAVLGELRRKAVGHKERGWFTQLLTDDGRTIWKSDDCPDIVTAWPVARDRSENLVQAGGYRFARRRISDTGTEPLHVRVGMPTAYLDEDIDTLTQFILPLGIGLSLLTPLVGYLLAVRATRPIAEIVRTADALKPTRLGDRLAVHGTHDELDQLAVTVNRLLDQVAGYVERQQQFVADAAHELRGPLAAMRSTLEVAVSQPRDPHADRDTLAEVLEETRHLAKLANDLLLLAELADGAQPWTLTDVDLQAVARQAVAMFSGVGEERSVAVELVDRPPATVAADVSAVRRILSNLLDNALRFTPPGGRVTVDITPAGMPGWISLTVTDTGTGIAPEHLGRVFDRFYKTDPSRSHGDAGRSGGLGLPICRSLAERMGGTLTIASQPGQGTTVSLRLPQPSRRAQPAN